LKRTTLVLALAALLTLGIASVADAHVLSKKRATQATLEFEFAECVGRPDLYPGCAGAAAGPCKRLTLHKVKCLGHIFGTPIDPATGLPVPIDCHRVYAWKIKPGKPASRLFGKVGPQTCGPDTEHPRSRSRFKSSGDQAKSSGNRATLDDFGDPRSGYTVTYP
jgi:hypothetical protein